MHSVNSILINSKTTNWLKIGQGAKFLSFAGNIAGMVPTAFDIRANGLNADNFLDGMISGFSFVPVFGWVLSPTLQGWKNSVEQRIKEGDGEGGSVTTENVIDGIFRVVSFVPPVGWVISSGYTLNKEGSKTVYYFSGDIIMW